MVSTLSIIKYLSIFVGVSIGIYLEQNTHYGSAFVSKNNNTWLSWDHEQKCQPLSYTDVHSEDDIVRVVKQACSEGARVRITGVGMSSPTLGLLKCQPNTTHLISTRQYSLVVRDQENMIRVQSGITITSLLQHLSKQGKTLAGQSFSHLNGRTSGEATVGGAVAAGLYAADSLPFHHLVSSFRIINGQGEPLECSQAATDTISRECFGARVSLGHLGVISEVSLRTVSAQSSQEHTESVYWFGGSSATLKHITEPVATLRCEVCHRVVELLITIGVVFPSLSPFIMLTMLPRLINTQPAELSPSSMLLPSYNSAQDHVLVTSSVDLFLPTATAQHGVQAIWNLLSKHTNNTAFLPLTSKTILPDSQPAAWSSPVDFNHPWTVVTVSTHRRVAALQAILPELHTIVETFKGKTNWHWIETMTQDAQFTSLQKKLDPASIFSKI